jgi:hypothetical protein
MAGALAGVALLPLGLGADTIYQTNAQGRRVVVHRDAIIIHEDSSLIVYKHFELKERRVVKARLSKGSLPYTLERTDARDRARIVSVWRRFGHSALVTDTDGKTTRVDGTYLDFYPPGGRGSLLESVPPRTSFPVALEGGSFDEFDFAKVSRILFSGDSMLITLRDGRTGAGRFFMPTTQPAEARFLGMTENYDPSSEEVFDFGLPLERIKEIRFE